MRYGIETCIIFHSCMSFWIKKVINFQFCFVFANVETWMFKHKNQVKLVNLVNMQGCNCQNLSNLISKRLCYFTKDSLNSSIHYWARTASRCRRDKVQHSIVLHDILLHMLQSTFGLGGRAYERSGAGRFAAPSLKPFLLHPAPHSDPRSGHFSKAANCSAPIQPIF